MSLHIAGEEEAILVISLNPPAASMANKPFSSSALATTPTKDEATTCGTWLIAAVI